MSDQLVLTHVGQVRSWTS